MIYVFLAVICGIAAVVLSVKSVGSSGDSGAGLYKPGAFVASLLAIGCLLMTSFSYIGDNEVGHLVKKIGSKKMAAGQIIAIQGETGPQAEILAPGWNFRPLLNIIYDVEKRPVVIIDEGFYGILIAKDGASLGDGEYLANPWKEEDKSKMLQADYFLSHGGQRGPQYDVLTPATYRFNQYLWKVVVKPALDVKTGEVAVLRANIQTRDEACPNVITASKTENNNDLAAPIVPDGCIGIQETPLTQGRYYKNALAYVPTMIPVRALNWQYKGGYTQRTINLTLSDKGEIIQTETKEEILVPKDAADQAINVRVEGWTVPVELRVQVQVRPENAPRVVASVGSLEKVEDVVVTPALRDILRTIGGKTDRKVLDFIEKRDEIVALVEKAIAVEAAKAGVTVQEVRMGEPAIPPEIMVARLREQLADQMKQTFTREKEAQDKRIAAEESRATANQQVVLVEAKIADEAANYAMSQMEKEGKGEKLKQMEIAKGRKALVDVLGQERTMQIEMVKMILAVAEKNPDIIKVPMVQVSGGSGSSLEGAAAVLGSSNFANLMNQNKKP
jgi:hypothetical protein